MTLDSYIDLVDDMGESLGKERLTDNIAKPMSSTPAQLHARAQNSSCPSSNAFHGLHTTAVCPGYGQCFRQKVCSILETERIMFTLTISS